MIRDHQWGVHDEQSWSWDDQQESRNARTTSWEGEKDDAPSERFKRWSDQSRSRKDDAKSDYTRQARKYDATESEAPARRTNWGYGTWKASDDQKSAASYSYQDKRISESYDEPASSSTSRYKWDPNAEVPWSWENYTREYGTKNMTFNRWEDDEYEIRVHGKLDTIQEETRKVFMDEDDQDARMSSDDHDAPNPDAKGKSSDGKSEAPKPRDSHGYNHGDGDGDDMDTIDHSGPAKSKGEGKSRHKSSWHHVDDDGDDMDSHSDRRTTGPYGKSGSKGKAKGKPQGKSTKKPSKPVNKPNVLLPSQIISAPETPQGEINLFDPDQREATERFSKQHWQYDEHWRKKHRFGTSERLNKVDMDNPPFPHNRQSGLQSRTALNRHSEKNRSTNRGGSAFTIALIIVPLFITFLISGCCLEANAATNDVIEEVDNEMFDLEVLDTDKFEDFARAMADRPINMHPPDDFSDAAHIANDHHPYSDTCFICVACRGREKRHQKTGRKRTNLLAIDLAQCFKGDEYDMIATNYLRRVHRRR